MKNSNSFRLHFLRSEGDQACNIRNPIVSIEGGRSGFTPRRPEPGETYPYERWFKSKRDLNEFLMDREQRYVDHDKLFLNQEHYGVDPYYEFVAHAEDSESYIQPGLPSLGGWQRHRAFHYCIEDYVLELRSKLLLAAEFSAVCRDPFAILRSTCPYDTDADLNEAAARMRNLRKGRWMRKRPELPPGTPRFYRDAQQWLQSRRHERAWMLHPEDECRCELAGECKCANAAENFRQTERKWSEEYERDVQSIRDQLRAFECQNVWDDEG
jgi:hypothetical protein